MDDLALLLDLFENSEETKLLICTAIFVWCLQRRRNGGFNSGQKSAIIITDASTAAPKWADSYVRVLDLPDIAWNLAPFPIQNSIFFATV